MTPRRLTLLAAAVAGSLLAWLVFARFVHLRMQIGLTTLESICPVEYQVTLFPAFSAFVAAIGFDWRRGAGWRNVRYRVALVFLCGALALVRLAGFLPFSGHALFLSAALGYLLIPPREDGEDGMIAGLAALGLAIVSYYKLFVFADGWWLGASIVVGLGLGAACRWRDRRTA